MSKKFLNDIDMDQNQVLNMRVQNLESAPSNAKEGQIYYDSTTKRMYKYNGTKWEALSEVVLIQFALINLEPGCAAQDIYNAFTNSENATKADAEAVLAKIQAGTPTFIIKDSVNIVIPVTTYIMANRTINLNFILQNTLYYFTIFTNIRTGGDWSLPMNNKKAYGLVPEDWLDSDDTTSPLSANQGRILKELVDQANEVEISDTEPTDVNKKLFIDTNEEPEGDFVYIGDIIDNLESTSSTDALSANQGRILNEKFNYSTDEQIIGKWIDGKTLYRKTFVFTGITATSANVSFSSLNTSETVMIDSSHSYVSTSGNFSLPVNMYHTSTDYIRAYVHNRDKNLFIEFGSVYTMSKNIYVTLKYTKTTD